MPKDLVFLNGEIRSPPFSENARKEAGHLIRTLQMGESLSMPLSRPMPDIAAGCHELRIRDAAHNWRILYAITDDAILVLAVFAKTTQKTPHDVIKRAQDTLGKYFRATR